MDYFFNMRKPQALLIFIAPVFGLVFTSVFGSIQSWELGHHFCYYSEYKTIAVCIDDQCTQTVPETKSYIVRKCCDGWYGDFCNQKKVCDELRVTDLIAGDVFSVKTDLFDPVPNALNVATFSLDPSLTFMQPIGIDVDNENGVMFYTDFSGERILVSSLDGSNPQVFHDTGAGSQCWGIAVDAKKKYLFYADVGSPSKIVRIKYIPGVVTPIVTVLLEGGLNFLSVLELPRDIELNVENEEIYYTEWGSQPGIFKINYDGTGFQSLVTSIDTDVVWPNGLALDLKDGNMYWCDGFLEVIKKADLNGNNIVELYSSPVFAHFNDIELNGLYLYLTNWQEGSLQRISKYGGPLEDFGTPGFTIRAMSIAVVCTLQVKQSQFTCAEGYYGTYCHIQCPPTFVFNDNGSPCIPTCENPNPDCNSAPRVSRCECAANEVLLGEQCIPAINCPPGIQGSKVSADGPYDCLMSNPCIKGDGDYAHNDKDKYVSCIGGTCSIKQCTRGTKFANGKCEDNGQEEFNLNNPVGNNPFQ